MDPLNQTLSFQEGEELELRDWSAERRGWSQRTPQTLMEALANMEVNSAHRTTAEAEQGAVHLTFSCYVVIMSLLLVVMQF